MPNTVTPGDPDFARQLYDDRLVVARILYFFPDYPSLLQVYIWQDYDRVPEIPRLTKFLKFWIDNLDGSLHSVRYEFQGHIHVPAVAMRQRIAGVEITGGRA